MRRIVFAQIFVVLLWAPGCGSFTPERITLSDDQVDKIAAVATDKSAEAWRKAAEEVFEVKIEKLEAKVDENTGAVNAVTLTLPAIAKEAASVGGASALEKIAQNPTTSGIGAAALAGVAGVFALWSRRSRLRREAKTSG